MTFISRPVDNLTTQDTFSEREVGLNHPDQASFVKLTDNGDIEIYANDGCMIVLHPANRGITLVGDRIRFLTKEFNGLLWNDLAFNPQATKYTEATFFELAEDERSNIYKGADQFWSDEVSNG